MAGIIILSARMQAVADMVERGNRVLDVGCDHGYVPIYLVQQKIAPEVLAMDVNKGPLRRAEEHVGKAGLLQYITLRLSDGLTAYKPGEADTLICAGMGGRLMQQILEREPEKAESFQEMILQPQSELLSFRRFLRETGYSIIEEDMILEEEKFYPVMKVIPDKKCRAEMKSEEEEALFDRFGPVLLARRHPVLIKYLQKEWAGKSRLKEELLNLEYSKRAGKRISELEKELLYLKEALKMCGCER